MSGITGGHPVAYSGRPERQDIEDSIHIKETLPDSPVVVHCFDTPI
jgi:hypothetical protein